MEFSQTDEWFGIGVNGRGGGDQVTSDVGGEPE